MLFIERELFMKKANRAGLLLDKNYCEPECLVFGVSKSITIHLNMKLKPNKVYAQINNMFNYFNKFKNIYIWKRWPCWAKFEADLSSLFKLSRKIKKAINCNIEGGFFLKANEVSLAVNVVACIASQARGVNEDVFVFTDVGDTLLYFDHHGYVHIQNNSS